MLVSGPTTPMTLVTAGIVAASLRPNGDVNLNLIVAIFLLTGAFQVVLGLLRLGSFIRYVPYPVISGFMSGIGVIIIIQQIFPMAGMALPSSDPAAIIARLHTLPSGFAWPVALLSAATLAIIYLLPRVIRVVPSSLLALLAVTAVSLLFGADVPRIGAIPAGLPAFVMPQLDIANAGFVLTAAAELALLGAVDLLLGALLADNLTKTHHDSNRELIGQGIGNMAAALIGGLPGAGANIRTIVNIKAGGRTPLSGVIHGLFLLAVLLGLSEAAGLIPNAVLSGILVAAGMSCIDLRGIGHIAKVPRADAGLMILVLLLTVFSGVIMAVAVGMIIAAFILMKKVADISEQQTTISPLADEPWADERSSRGGSRPSSGQACRGTIVLRLCARLYRDRAWCADRQVAGAANGSGQLHGPVRRVRAAGRLSGPEVRGPAYLDCRVAGGATRHFEGTPRHPRGRAGGGPVP